MVVVFDLASQNCLAQEGGTELPVPYPMDRLQQERPGWLCRRWILRCGEKSKVADGGSALLAHTEAFPNLGL